MRNNSSVGWSFPVKVNPVTGKIEMTNSENEIKQSILILLETYKGERLYHKSYGSSVNKYMFEPISRTLIKSLKTEILRTIKRWEKRAKNITVDIYNSVDNETMLIINIRYQVDEEGNIEEINYPLNLLED